MQKKQTKKNFTLNNTIYFVKLFYIYKREKILFRCERLYYYLHTNRHAFK